MKKPTLFWIALLILLCSGWPLPASDGSPHRVTLLFSGWVTGTFGPCGCKVDPNGGFPRRAGFSQAYQKETDTTVIQVDAGSLFATPGPRAGVVNATLVEGLQRLPMHVMNVGSEDLYMWSELADFQEHKTHFISSNLRARTAGVKEPEKYAILTLSAEQTGLEKELQIGFLGIVDPSRVKPNSGFRGVSPAEAVAEVMPELRGKVDFVVLLADYFRRETIDEGSLLYEIANSHPEIYAVITTERRYILHSPQQVNNAIILSSIERGRQLGRLVFDLDAGGAVTSYEGDFVNLDASTPVDPELANLLSRLP